MQRVDRIKYNRPDIYQLACLVIMYAVFSGIQLNKLVDVLLKLLNIYISETEKKIEININNTTDDNS